MYEEQNETSSNEKVNEMEEVKPVKLSKKTTGIVLIAFLLILLLVICTIKGCSISKEPVKIANTETTTKPKVQQTTPKTGDVDANNSENVPNNSSTSVATPNGNNSTNTGSNNQGTSQPQVQTPIQQQNPVPNQQQTQVPNQTTTQQPVQVNSNTLQKVDENVVLSNKLTATGIVTSKSIYMKETAYLYEVGIVVVTGNGTSTVCKYYCPRNSYDAVSMGTSLSVTYQLDGNGNISINTISK